MPYLEPTEQAGRAFFRRGIQGEVVMLNLLRFRAIADYSASPALAPALPISGAAAYDRYVAHTLPYLRASGGEIMFVGEAGGFLIGPPDESWDQVMLIRQSSVQSFMDLRRMKAISPASCSAPPRLPIRACCRWPLRRCRL